jgi:hypothetical protein
MTTIDDDRPFPGLKAIKELNLEGHPLIAHGFLSLKCPNVALL